MAKLEAARRRLVTLLIGTRKGLWQLHGDSTRRTWHLARPATKLRQGGVHTLAQRSRPLVLPAFARVALLASLVVVRDNR